MNDLVYLLIVKALNLRKLKRRRILWVLQKYYKICCCNFYFSLESELGEDDDSDLLHVEACVRLQLQRALDSLTLGIGRFLGGNGYNLVLSVDTVDHLEFLSYSFK